MTRLSGDDVKKIAGLIKKHKQDMFSGHDPMDWSKHYDETFIYEGTVVPKERPRINKRTGNVYTPTDTVKFEQAVRSWGLEQNMQAVLFPLKVSISIKERTSDPDLIAASLLNLLYNEKYDIDNGEKAILDGLNKVAWHDDRQIASLSVRRRWARSPGFSIRLQRAGLSKTEYKRVLRYLERNP